MRIPHVALHMILNSKYFIIRHTLWSFGDDFELNSLCLGHVMCVGDLGCVELHPCLRFFFFSLLRVN